MKDNLRIRKFLSLLLTMLVTGNILSASAQVFPIQVNTQLTPPYSPYLADYTSPGSQRLMVQLRSNDVNLGEYNVKLRITIEGVGITIRTKQNFIPQPITLQGGGIPVMLYGEDISEYFNPQNLDFAGFTRKEYESTGKIPEGVYRFSVEVLDYNRSIVVSNKGMTVAWMILNDPPLLNLPRKDTKVRILDPTNIAFTWTPRHTGSPNSAFSTEYTFRLVEIWPVNRNPYDAFLSQPALFEITTTQSQIVYGPAEPALIPGRKYAWQVQAVDTEGRDLFKNQGRSEVFMFQFGDEMGVPENLRKEGANTSTISVRWEPSANGEMPDQYRVRYKAAGNDRWFETVTMQNWVTLTQLKPNTAYEVQVRGERQKRFGEYTGVQHMNTAEEDPEKKFVCGQPTNIQSPSGTSILPALAPGDIFSTADFTVVVTEVMSASNGTYSGTGLMQVDMLNGASLEVSFACSINSDYKLTSGSVRSIYEKGSEISQMIDKMQEIGEQKQEEPKQQQTDSARVVVMPDILVQRKIDSIYVNEEGKIKVVDEEGNVTTYEPKMDENTGEVKETIIADSEGNMYTVDKDGAVTHKSNNATLASYHAKSNLVVFKPHTDQLYGFDEFNYDSHIANYEKKIINGTEVVVNWKSVATGGTDKTIAWTDNANYLDKVSYHDMVSELPARKTQNGIEITIVGTAHQQVTGISAHIQDTTKQDGKVGIGHLNVISYDAITRNLVLVPVNGSIMPSTALLKAELTKIFSPAIVTWNVSMKADIQVDLGADGKLADGSSRLLSNYTPEMRKIIRSFKNREELQDETYYLFLVAHGESGTREGYMPRKKQCGFIFSDGLRQEMLTKTIAHELGHGAFRLEHTFETYPSLPKGTTDNLMDYNSGTRLHKYQWDLIHNPVAVWGVFEKDEEGAYSWSRTLVDEQHTKLFDHVYNNNRIHKLVYLTEINRLLAEDPGKQTFDLKYNEDDEYEEWINSWKIRVVNSETVLNNTIKVIQSAKKGEKLGNIYLRPNHIYIAKYNYNERDYPIAIYNAGTDEVMKNVFTKVEVTDVDELKENENSKRVYIEETFFSYFIVAFYEEGKNQPTLMIQVEKFPISDLWHNSMTEWLKFLKILVNEKKKNSEDKNENVHNEEGLKRAEIANKIDISDTRFYGRFIEPERLIDDYVDCAEFVYDVLKEQGFTTLPSGDCIAQSNWYKAREEEGLCTTGTDIDKVVVGDILLWTGTWTNAKEYAHTGIVVQKSENTVSIVHAGQKGCKCDEGGSTTWKSHTIEVRDEDTGEKKVVQKYASMQECYDACTSDNYSVYNTSVYFDSKTLNSKDHILNIGLGLH